ncbi:MAG: hypothetical protein R6V55_07840 [Desulfovermiculus sp.]
MQRDSYQISRQDLYEQVWEVPMSKLAQKYQMSDVGLAKICKKYNIPRPPRGYWAKKSAGIRVERVPLPSKTKNELITIHSNPDYYQDNEAEYTQKKNPPDEDIGEIQVAKRLSNPHPLVEKAASILHQAQPNQHGLLETRTTDCLNIKVSKKVLPRALRIMDALFNHFTELKFETCIRKGNTVVTIDDIEIHIGIREELRKERKPIERNLEERYRFWHSSYEQVYVPSGNLCLSVLNHYSSNNLQKNWRDTQTKQLEGQLTKFMKVLLRIVAKEKEAIRQQEERERQRREKLKRIEEQKRRREELQARMDHERNRVDTLINDAENWKKSQVLKEFILAVKKARDAGGCAYEPDCGWEEWFKWARDQADRLNPLVQSPPSITDEELPEIEEHIGFYF